MSGLTTRLWWRKVVLHLCAVFVLCGAVLLAGTGEAQAQVQGDRACDPGYLWDAMRGCYQDPNARSDYGKNALALFYFSMGRTADGTAATDATCLTCDFITYFTNAIANFSASIFLFFQEFFIVLAPLFLAIWIAARVIRLSISGGQGGGQFFSDMVRKLALFLIAWVFLFNGFGMMGPAVPGSGVGGTTYYAGPAWHLTAPNLLEYSFDLNNDVRARTAAGLLQIGGGNIDSSPFECAGLDARVTSLVNNQSLNPAIHSITQTACVVERMHMLGISTGVALITSAWNQRSFTVDALVNSNFKTLWGLVLIGVYGISGVWLVFLILDVVTKALIVSAFLPIFGLAVLFPATQEVAKRALMQFVAVPVVAFALGLTNLLGFFLIMGTIDSYNATYQQMSATYNADLTPIVATGTIERFAEFIQRIQMPTSADNYIPATLTSPWLHYLMLVGLGIFSLGRKIVSIIENIMGIEGSSAMADNAKAMAMKGVGLGMATGLGIGKVAMSAVPVAGAVGAAALGGAGMMAGQAGKGVFGQAGADNVKGVGRQMARAGVNSAMRRVNPFARRGE